jgi:DNA-binding CsgD family transcriptional regulator
MLSLQPLASVPISPAVLERYEQIVDTMGSEAFIERAGEAVRQLAHVDRLYLFDLRKGVSDVRPFLQFYEHDKPPIAHETYVRHFLPTDPIQRAIGASSAPPGMIQIRVEPRDIIAPTYRRMLESAGIRERVSYLRRASWGWQCMTVARKACSGVFEDRELSMLGSLARLVMPLIERNDTLSRCRPGNYREALSEMESRFRRLFPRLTERERNVCARAVIGMTASETATDLGIAVSSVLTYRKRAYRRLGVASAIELAGLVTR